MIIGRDKLANFKLAKIYHDEDVEVFDVLYLLQALYPILTKINTLWEKRKKTGKLKVA